MWSVLRRFGCLVFSVNLIIAQHDGMVERVCTQNALSVRFPISGGLKPGYVLVPTLFSIYLAVMLNEIPRGSTNVNIRYSLDGRLFITSAH